MLDLKVENDAHLAEIATSIFIDGKSLARLLGIVPLKPEEQEDVGKDRYVIACKMTSIYNLLYLRTPFEECQFCESTPRASRACFFFVCLFVCFSSITASQVERKR